MSQVKQNLISSVTNLAQKCSPEVFYEKCSMKKVFLEILQNSQENTCARVSFLIKLQALGQYCEVSKNNVFTKHLRTSVVIQIALRVKKRWKT